MENGNNELKLHTQSSELKLLNYILGVMNSYIITRFMINYVTENLRGSFQVTMTNIWMHFSMQSVVFLHHNTPLIFNAGLLALQKKYIYTGIYIFQVLVFGIKIFKINFKKMCGLLISDIFHDLETARTNTWTN